LAFSYWIDNLGFITEGKLAAIFIKPSLGVFQLAGHLLHIATSTWQQKFSIIVAEIEEEASISLSPRHQQVFWRRCRGLNYIFPRQLCASKMPSSVKHLMTW
jgi:hypothetical protein